jgi:hypothetical protein
MRTLKEIEDSGYVAIQNAITEAYNAGLADGRRESEELRNKIVAILSPSTVAATATESAVFRDKVEGVVIRAAPGTVKPEILRLIRSSDGGLTTEEIIAYTGFKASSVRGTISTLQAEHEIEKQGDRWVASFVSTPASAGNGNPDAAASGSD